MFVARHVKADAAKKNIQSIQGGYNFSFSQFFFLKITIYRTVWFSREVMDYDQEFSFSPEVTDYEQVEISLSIMGVRLNT